VILALLVNPLQVLLANLTPDLGVIPALLALGVIPALVVMPALVGVMGPPVARG